MAKKPKAKKPRGKKNHTLGTKLVKGKGKGEALPPGTGALLPRAPLTGGPKASVVELALLRATIRCLDEAVNAHGSIPSHRQDSELRGVLADYRHVRAVVMTRLERVRKRTEE